MLSRWVRWVRCTHIEMTDLLHELLLTGWVDASRDIRWACLEKGPIIPSTDATCACEQGRREFGEEWDRCE